MDEKRRLEIQEITLHWIKEIYDDLKDGQRDWVGVYWKETFLHPEKSASTDLIVGPYIGPETPHVRIPISQGLCGLAVREGRTVNVDDVRSDSQFLACSISTRSEIVIPIANSNGEIIGELDIDSNVVSGFDRQTQDRLEAQIPRLVSALKL